MADIENKADIWIDLVGPFRVLSATGEDLSPRGRKACGLLALLAVSPERRRSRAWLQDKLWSDRPPKQGGASLRQALSEIRRAFGPQRDCLRSDRRIVALDPERLHVDLDGADLAALSTLSEQPVLLEDIDIGDAEFEGWVRNQRLGFEFRLANIKAKNLAAEAEPSAMARPSVSLSGQPWLRLLPPVFDSGDGGAFLSQFVGDRITQGLIEHWGIELTDTPSGPNGIQIGVEARRFPHEVCLNVRILAGENASRVWSGSKSIRLNEGSVHDSPELQILVNQSIEVAGIHLRRLGHSHDSATAFASAHDAVHAMFRIEMDEVFRADALLADAFRHEPKGVYLAWRAYARTFVFGEAPGIDGPAVMEEAEALARHAFELDPHNATVLALISYVHSFLCRRYEAGHELTEQSLKYNPSHPLGHAFLGRAKSYLGRHDEGYRLARKGLDRSGQAPYLYTLHFLSGVTALQSSKLREAAAAAEIAIAMAPNYRAPRRYLVPLYLKLGERDKARSALEKLRELEPRFSLDAMRQSAYPSTAIREAGLLVFSDRDL